MTAFDPLETNYYSFLKLAAGLNFLIYSIPAAIILGAIAYFGIPSNYWTPVLIIYGIGAIGHMLAIGFHSILFAIKTCTDGAVDELKEQFSGN